MNRPQNPTTKVNSLIKSYTKACASGSLSNQNKIYTQISKELKKTGNN